MSVACLETTRTTGQYARGTTIESYGALKRRKPLCCGKLHKCQS
jgi:hypothetical protein